MIRPNIHLNCASTADGKLSFADGTRLRISDDWDMRRVHTLRQRYGAILVGAGTIIKDDPKLTVKGDFVQDPIPITKVILDGAGSVSPSSKFLKTPGPSVIFIGGEVDHTWTEEVLRRNEEREGDITIIPLHTKGGLFPLNEAVSRLHHMGIDRLLVEGGPTTLWGFLNKGLWDRFTVYFGPMLVGGRGPGITGGRGTFDPLAIKLENVMKTEEGGVLLDYLPVRIRP